MLPIIKTKNTMIMTPKEKAKELGNKYLSTGMLIRQAKECATISVEEMLNFMFLSENENSFWINYYNKVKTEIDKL
jgi:hypothetical protein